MRLEKDTETRFKERLEAWGFKVLKLKTPGTSGVMDRMILRPKYSPGAPSFVEFKRLPGRMASLQEGIYSDWLQRGVKCHRAVWGHEEADKLADELILSVQADYNRAHMKGDSTE